MSDTLYIYWRCEAARVAQAVAAVQALQRDLRARHPALQAGLHRRADDDAAGAVTLMETYAAGPALDLLRAVQAETQAALAGWALGPRHVECFRPV